MDKDCYLIPKQVQSELRRYTEDLLSFFDFDGIVKISTQSEQVLGINLVISTEKGDFLPNQKDSSRALKYLIEAYVQKRLQGKILIIDISIKS